MPTLPMTFSPTDGQHSEREGALRRATALGRVLFSGLDSKGLLLPDHHRAITCSSLPSAAALAGALVEAGVATPCDLARFLSGFDPRDARGYSQALWNAVCVVNVASTSSPSWAEIYAELDAQTLAVDDSSGDEDDDEANENQDAHTADVAHVKLWAEEVGEEIAGIERILGALRSRPGHQLDRTDAVGEMMAALESIHAGELPAEMWRVELTHNQGDETAGGRRAFSIAIDGEGIDAQSAVIDWQPGELDCCGGEEFRLRPGIRGHGAGDFIAFASEFEDAIVNLNYVLTVQFNDEEIGLLPLVAPSDSEGERIAKRCLRALAEDLQEMQETISGDDSGFENVWDEICAQKRVEESFSWEAYETTVRALIAGAVEDLLPEERVKLWLLTEPGEDWEADKESPDERPSPCEADVVDFLFDRLMALASDYLNHRIIRYRDRVRD